LPLKMDIEKKDSSTYKFVKETKRDRYWKARAEEIAYLRDPSTGKIKEAFADPVDKCLVCENNKLQLLFEKEGFDFLHCNRCDLIMANPQIKEEALRRNYKGSSSSDVWVDVLTTESNQAYDQEKFERGIQLIQRYQPKKGRILDIGCSIGHFLKVAKENGWEELGLELNQKALDWATKVFKVKVNSQLLPEAKFASGSFEAVTLWGVIEHLKEPKEVMTEVKRILKPGGIILIFCPNVGSLVARMLREHTSTFDGRNHCAYFSKESLTYLLDQTGFQVLERKYFQPGLDTMLNYLNFTDPYLKSSGKSNPLKELFDAEARNKLNEIICQEGLGYKQMFIAQRK